VTEIQKVYQKDNIPLRLLICAIAADREEARFVGRKMKRGRACG